MSNWIGGGFGVLELEQMPHVKDRNGGSGVQAQRQTIPQGKRPHVKAHNGGSGVQPQRVNIPQGKRPHVTNHNGESGVQPQRVTIENPDTLPISGERLLPWFHALAKRLKKVVVLSRDFTSALTSSVLQQSPSTLHLQTPVCVFLDPPYRTETGRADTLYASDYSGTSEDTAQRAYQWAVENGRRPNFKIAYAMYEGDFPVPSGWDVEYLSIGGYGGHKDRRDCVIFNPQARLQGMLL